MKTLCLLVVTVLVTIATQSHAFNCIEAAEMNLRSDDKILDILKTQAGPVSIECLASLLRGNHFTSVNFAIDTLDAAQIDEALDAVKKASLIV